MFDDMRAQGVYPVVASGYRTSEKQQELMNEKIAELKEQGYSNSEAKTEARRCKTTSYRFSFRPVGLQPAGQILSVPAA